MERSFLTDDAWGDWDFCTDNCHWLSTRYAEQYRYRAFFCPDTSDRWRTVVRSFLRMESDDAVAISLAEVFSSLSYALDLTSGQPMGHAQRTCLIGLRLAAVLNLPLESRSTLYYALLMKDTGCSTNAARMAQIFGSDDISAKQVSKITDWSNLLEAAKYAAAHTLPQGSLLARAQRLLHIVTHKKETTDDLMQARCDRGAQIALHLGLGEEAADCIRHLDEHWDGNGGPAHRKGDAIPLLGRIACLAQTLEVFAKTFDVPTAYAILRKRSGKWFDPELVRAASAFEQDEAFWEGVFEQTRDALLSLDIRATIEAASQTRLDAICEAFAQIVDAKSPFTAQHSSRVSAYSVQIGRELGLSEERLTLLRRAGLLHDLGKLGVSNTILDKPGKPTDTEWDSIRRHPRHTFDILRPIHGFERINRIAAAHHERLDGKGYFLGMSADQLDQDMRILAVADVFDALSAERPYRGALPLEEVFAIFRKDDGVGLDSECIAALRDIYRGQSHPQLSMATNGSPTEERTDASSDNQTHRPAMDQAA
jgi:putative nucleotidyltransferase with HDIG domain